MNAQELQNPGQELRSLPKNWGRYLERSKPDSDLPPALVESLGRMADDEKVAAVLNKIVHPNSNATLLPVTLEKIDEAAGHYLFIAVEQRF